MEQTLVVRIQNDEDIKIGNYQYSNGSRTLHSSKLYKNQSASHLFSIPN